MNDARDTAPRRTLAPTPRLRLTRLALAGACATLPALTAFAQGSPAQPAPASSLPGWQQCAALGDTNQRLACYDAWATAQPKTQGGVDAVPAPLATLQPPTAPVNAEVPATRVINVAEEPGCRDPQYSEYSRFWELENGTDCGTFNIRGYRPLSLSVAAASSVNTAPSSPSPGHTATSVTPYSDKEMRIQLSVRTKIAQGLLTQGDPARRDSVWFGYTQQSYWQLFNGQISRPFRETNHEPEIIYVYPLDWQFSNGWRMRYGGLGLVHQSNGQSLPLSRSWNRVYAMMGLEADDRWGAQFRLWKRLPESAAKDDNPDIVDYIGRGELSAYWNLDKVNTLQATVRHTLNSTNRGGLKLEWMRALGNTDGKRSNLRLHTTLFTGYGDSLIDYNRYRTVLTVGLSLLDF